MLRVLLGNDFGLQTRGHVVSLQQIASRIVDLRPDADCRFGLCDSKMGIEIGVNPDQILVCDFLGRMTVLPDLHGSTTCCGMWAQRLLANSEVFSAHLKGWSEIIAEYRPHVVVADYAPCLSRAAIGRVPLVVVGNGYNLSPPELPHCPPLYEAWQCDEDEEARQVELLNQHLTKAGLMCMTKLPEINLADAYGLRTIPAFDLYHKFRKQPYFGVVHPGGSPRPLAGPGLGFFAYFSSFGSLQSAQFLAAELEASGVPGEANLGGYSKSDLGLSSPDIVITQGISKLAEALPHKAVIVHKGSLGVGSAALFAGVPQIILYDHGENWANGIAAMRCGVGAAVELTSLRQGELAEAIRGVVGDVNLRARALAQAEAHQEFRGADPARKIAEQVIALAG